MWFFWKSTALTKLSEQLEEHKRLLKKLRYEQLELIARVGSIERLIDDCVCKRRLGPVGFKITNERNENMADMIQFKVNLPPKAAPDVVSRELVVVIANGDPDVRVLDAEASEVAGYEGPQDSTVNVSLVDVDDSGNRSEASTVDFVLVDLVPPPMPGELGVVVVDETYDDKKDSSAEG